MTSAIPQRVQGNAAPAYQLATPPAPTAPTASSSRARAPRTTSSPPRHARVKIAIAQEGAAASFRPVDPEEAAAAATYGLKPGYLLSLGTQEPNKNRGAIIRALSAARHRPGGPPAGGGRWRRLANGDGAGSDRGAGADTADPLHRLRSAGGPSSPLQRRLGLPLPVAARRLWPRRARGDGLRCAGRHVEPLIATEVVGDAALLVDPEDTHALATATSASSTTPCWRPVCERRARRPRSSHGRRARRRRLRCIEGSGGIDPKDISGDLRSPLYLALPRMTSL